MSSSTYTLGIKYYEQGKRLLANSKALYDSAKKAKIPWVAVALIKDANAYYHASQKEFLKAITKFTLVIKKGVEVTEAYRSRGAIYHNLFEQASCYKNTSSTHRKELLAYAIRDYIKADDHEVKNYLAELLEKTSKNDVFEAIKILAKEEQLILLKEAKNSKTELGFHFWKKRGLFDCRLEKGYLKKIADQIVLLEKNDSVFNNEEVFDNFYSL